MQGVPVVHDPDQYSTDLGKCLASLVEEEERRGKVTEHQLVISGGLSGRLDQTVHTIHALLQLASTRERAWAVGADSIACVLGKVSDLVSGLTRGGKELTLIDFTGQTRALDLIGLLWQHLWHLAVRRTSSRHDEGLAVGPRARVM